MFKVVIIRFVFFSILQDTGISVRKRVIKILRDICINHPDFPKTTEIYVKIIRRICDEEGIKVWVMIYGQACMSTIQLLILCSVLLQ